MVLADLLRLAFGMSTAANACNELDAFVEEICGGFEHEK